MRASKPKDAMRREGRSVPACWGEKERVHVWGREREKALSLLLLCFFLPRACPMQTGLSQERYLFYLRSSFWSSDLPLLSFHGLFPSLSFSHRHFRLLFPILTTYQDYLRKCKISPSYSKWVLYTSSNSII